MSDLNKRKPKELPSPVPWWFKEVVVPLAVMAVLYLIYIK